MTSKTAFVVGYTGECGKALIKELTSSDKFSKIILIGRRSVTYEDPTVQELEQRVVDFENLDASKEAFQGIDVGFCCLGTTKAQAGSAEAFKRIDHDYVLNLAEVCKAGGTKHFHYISSAGADKNSSFLYPRTKGLIEQALGALMFDRLSIYRPKLLDCEREQGRAGEKVYKFITAPIAFFKPSVVLTKTSTLAKAMIENTFNETKQPVEIIFNNSIYLLGGERP